MTLRNISAISIFRGVSATPFDPSGPAGAGKMPEAFLLISIQTGLRLGRGPYSQRGA